MSEAMAESYARKMQKYLAQNRGRALTDNQLRRLGPAPEGSAPVPTGEPVADQYNQQQLDTPITPQVDTSDPQVMQVDELVEFIANQTDPTWRGQTFRVDSEATEAYEVKQQLVAVRSKVGKAARRAGLDYSTQVLQDDQGEFYLAVHLGL